MASSKFFAWNTLFISVMILVWMYFADSYSVLYNVL